MGDRELGEIRAEHRRVNDIAPDCDDWTEEAGITANIHRGVLLAEVDRLTEALRSIAYEGGGCLAVEAGGVTLSTPSIEADEDEDETCGVCAVCWARQALGTKP